MGTVFRAPGLGYFWGKKFFEKKERDLLGKNGPKKPMGRFFSEKRKRKGGKNPADRSKKEAGPQSPTSLVVPNQRINGRSPV
jgi:hypothetical protein